MQSLPVRIGERGARAVAMGCAAAGVALGLWAGSVALALAGALMVGMSLWPALLRRRVLGPLTVDALLALPWLVRLLQ